MNIKQQKEETCSLEPSIVNTGDRRPSVKDLIKALEEKIKANEGKNVPSLTKKTNNSGKMNKVSRGRKYS